MSQMTQFAESVREVGFLAGWVCDIQARKEVTNQIENVGEWPKFM